MFKTILKHSAVYGIAPQLPKLVSIVTLPIITKYLTPLDYGVYGIITAYTAAISVFSTLGLRLRMVNTFYKHPHRYQYAWRQFSGFLFFWNFPFALVSAVLIYIAIPKEAAHHVWTIIALNVASIIIYGRASLLGTTYFQLTKQPKKVVARTILASLLSIGFNVYFIAVLKMGYMGWFWSTFLSSVITNGMYWYVVNFKLNLKPIYNFKRRYIKESLKVCLPTVPHYYSSYLLDVSDRMIMSILRVPAPSIGKYNASYTFGNYYKTFGVSAGLAIGPFYQENYKQGNYAACRNIIFNFQALFIISAAFLGLWIKEIMALLIKNAELAATYPIAIVILMAYTARPLYNGIGMAVMYHEKNQKLWRFTFTAGIANVLINLAFIPIYGYKVAAISTFVANMLMAFSMYLIREYRKLIVVPYYPLLWLLAIIAVCVSVYLMRDLPVIAKLFISLPVMALMVLLYIRYKSGAGKSKWISKLKKSKWGSRLAGKH